ncbi:MAG: hypothetical protein ACOYLQ_19920 [Hyphomicrobiaceae bacterium]
MLQIWDVDWYLDEAQCPCDVHFTQWIDETGVAGRTIFHFGTGGHHHLGLHNLERDTPNTILGITASPPEFQRFIELAIKHPRLSHAYQVWFGDIYLLNPRLLPPLDIVTLFHTGEFRGDSQDAYGALTDRQVADVLLDRLAPGGWVALFTGSFAYDKAAAIADDLVAEGRIVPAGDFKSLKLYRKA